MTDWTSPFSLNQAERDLIESKLSIKRQLAQARERELFDVLREGLSEEESWALKYLFAYMPVNDLADYDGALFLSHVRSTLAIRRLVPWGDRVPDSLFLHYVLPYRVNTENIEDHRGILFNELAYRTKSLTMEEAILETNYWCHEKAAYIGSDLRTMSPLTMIKSARGRCGEESTLAVAALRSIGIPARQIYTPRWAHCDDNHAWVEAWADGKWHFLGACEPEARLNQGWFGPPARRAMLLNTRILADYPGPEDIIAANGWFTEINLLENYAPTRIVALTVKDGAGHPVPGAEVRFELYNMAEFYPIATLLADERGEISFKTGYGDLLVRAAWDNLWGEVKLAAGGDIIRELVLDRTEQPGGTLDLDMVPPPEGEGEPAKPLPGEQGSRHAHRVEEGTKLRTAYESTFASKPEAEELAVSLGLPAERVWSILSLSRGNFREIASFLRERTAEYGPWPLRLMESLREKDWIDARQETLNDHLIGSLAVRGEWPDEEFIPYILCPRVLHEMIVPYRQFFQAAFTEQEREAFRSNASALAHWLNDRYGEWEDLPNLKGKGNPVGTFRLRRGDRDSLDILFVAVCRSLGIPARLHPQELKPQYKAGGEWRDAMPDAKSPQPSSGGDGSIRLLRDPEAAEDAPEPSYAENFTIARLEKNGFYKTLIYPPKFGDVYGKLFEAEPGSYRITTGVRLRDGTVLARFSHFAVREGENTDVELTYRKAALELPVLGVMDRARPLAGLDGSPLTMGDLITGDDAIVAWIEPEREPTKHLLRELGELAVSAAYTGAAILLLIGDAESTLSFNPAQYPQLQSEVTFARDCWQASLPPSANREAGFPHLFVLDSQDRIRYAASGYKIGMGKEAIQALAAARQTTPSLPAKGSES
ncbi:transglutaminase-like domain-containing protein [Paenibacillus sp. BK720]|uniref:transglutaminase-like domain-containing protein n=1 Tax=Paenibacillus sp. BK720 TaxID=2587092 RepID=UPI0014217D82|nr:transglutaminase-like domain-containing protein [Paenibacillus sp. BK720]NIK66902.1 transglutaminase-like putative cysteine protease [Paenibacillus sp. BK720]